MVLRRSVLRLALVAPLVLIAFMARPEAPEAKANPVCGAVTGGIVGEAVTGAIGVGNPVGDACNAVTDGAVEAITSPITGAVEGLGNDIFGQITGWVSGGASWLIGQVVRLSDETTTPDLTTAGFIAQYRKMAAIAVFLALAMLVFAVLESLGQGAGLLRVVLVNLPLALIASSVAFVVVQMLITATDGISHAVAVSTEKNSQHFFHSAIEGLGSAGGKAGAAIGGRDGDPVAGAVGHAEGSVAAPLFVVFLAAIIGAFAAFFVWVELLMRDAAIYVVALFAPMALAASIWPRWSGALRRTAELLCVIIASKFVIVSIIGLAAGLADESGGKVEHILAAAALMLLACFAPFVLFKLVPFAEGALAAGYGRHSAAGGAAGGAHLATSAMVMRNTAHSRWGGGAGGSGEGGGKKGGSGGAPAFKRSGGGAGGEAATAEAGPAAPVAAAAKAPVAAERGSRNAAQRLSQTATAEAGEGGGAGSSPPPSPSSGQGSGSGAAPKGEPDQRPGSSAAESASRPGAASAGEPLGGEAEPAGGEPPRPAPERSRGKADGGEQK